ncbi:MAG TPA: maleylacetoacetate isomerase [Polyangiaceae bacterium]|nr:maleylacetoacetate isomerase [Polyangiaceae bacterium]
MIRLYSYWRSSSAWRVRLGLAWKRVTHELVLVNLTRDGGEQNQPAFLERNPLAQVPVLEVSEGPNVLTVTQSVAILEYLEERFPARPLLPESVADRARVRQLVEIVNSGTQPFGNLGLRRAFEAEGADPMPFMRRAIVRGFGALEAIARATSGRYLVGDGVTLADMYLVPQFYNARRFGVDLEPYPTLLRVESACNALAEFQSAHPNAQPDYDPDA